MSPDEELDDQQLVLGDLLNHVLDKGVVISGQVTISIADIDLIAVDLRLLLSSVQTMVDRTTKAPEASSEPPDGHSPVLPPQRR